MKWEIIPIQKLVRFDTLTYSTPKNSLFFPGQLVYIPLRNSIIPGIIYKKSEAAPQQYQLREIQGLFDLRPILSGSQLNFCKWIANNYISTLSEVCYQLLPAKFRKVKKKDLKNSFLPSKSYELPREYKKFPQAVQPLYIQDSMKERFSRYNKLFAKTKGQTLILTPDINIIPKKILKTIPDLFIYQTQTPTKELESWQLIFKNQPKIILGSHKALLTPIKNLHTIILDQENHPQIQYDQKPYYNLREAAFFLAKKSGANFVLGSNLSSISSYKKIQEGILKSQKLSQSSLAKIKIFATDLKIPLEKQNLSYQSENLIEDHLQRKIPIAILILRKGYAQGIICKDCLNLLKCPECENPLKLERVQRLYCKNCNQFSPIPDKCSICQSTNLKNIGLGQEGIENYLKNRFPHSKLKTKNSKLKFDIAIITPKDLGNIGRIQDLILLRPESMLNSSAYNIKERLHQIIYSARMICENLYLETQIPTNAFWEKIRKPEEFLKSELDERKKFGLPPEKKIIQILNKSQKAKIDLLKIKKICEYTRIKNLEILGPAPGGMKSSDYQLLIKINREDFPTLAKILKNNKEYNLKYIVDPTDL